jgi:acetolactate synthase-1/2/3 large subunit
VEKIPYRASQALEFMQGLDTLILVGAQAPVGFFAYPGQPSEFTPENVAILVLTHPHEDSVSALEAVAEAFPANGMPPRNLLDRPEMPTGDGPLTCASIAVITAALLPDHAIVSDESITGTFGLYHLFDQSAPHDWLHLSGGAIGDGMPVATGAALACPDRKVVTLQADGSAMYTLQSLWTQARERLDVTTIIYANRSYKILVAELEGVGAGSGGPKSLAMFDLGNPALDWVHLAQGMGVEAVRAETVAQFASALRSAMQTRGPRLIEAIVE